MVMPSASVSRSTIIWVYAGSALSNFDLLTKDNEIVLSQVNHLVEVFMVHP